MQFLALIFGGFVLGLLLMLIFDPGYADCPKCGRELDPYAGKRKSACQWCGWVQK